MWRRSESGGWRVPGCGWMVFLLLVRRRTYTAMTHWSNTMEEMYPLTHYQHRQWTFDRLLALFTVRLAFFTHWLLKHSLIPRLSCGKENGLGMWLTKTWLPLMPRIRWYHLCVNKTYEKLIQHKMHIASFKDGLGMRLTCTAMENSYQYSVCSNCDKRREALLTQPAI